MKTPKNLSSESEQHGKSMIVLSPPSHNHRRSSADLPIEVRQAASHRWRLFPVPALGRFATAPDELQDAATCDFVVLEQLASECPDCNWALATGQASGVFALEVDSECGRTALHALSEEEWDCVETLQSKAGDTWHAFFRWPAGLTDRNKVIAPGLRIRGENDFVLIPPSRYCSGVPHAYVNPDAGIATTPTWLLDLVFRKPGGKSSGKILSFPKSPSQREASAVHSAASATKTPPFVLD
jgi:hypothetical protein